jgi:hypothetical protein
MSVSTSAVIASLIEKENEALRRATADRDCVVKILQALPADSPAPVAVYANGYCADAHIKFCGEGNAHRLYELYPPMECVDIKGHSQSQKPAKYLRPEEMRDNIRPIFPVVFKTASNEAKANWWTEINGIDVQIIVSNAVISEFKDDLTDGKYETDAHTYSTGSAAFFPRALAKPTVRPGAVAAWTKAWQAYGDELCFNEGQLSFLAAAAVYVYKQHTPNQDHYERVHFEGSPTRAQLALVTTKHGLYWNHLFTEEEKEQVLAFAQEQAKNLYAAIAQQKVEFGIVEDWLRDFFSKWGHLYDSDYDTKNRIKYKLQKDTGLDVIVRRITASRGRVSVSPYFNGYEYYPDWTFSLSEDESAPRLKPQDIEVDYA